MNLSKTTLIAGVTAAFVAAGLTLSRPAPDAADSGVGERGPFRLFTQNDAGRYVAGHDPVTQSSKPTAAVYCFPQHPTVHVAGKQVQLDVAADRSSLVVRGAEGRVQLQPADPLLGADIKGAGEAIRREADASGFVNRMAERLAL